MESRGLYKSDLVVLEMIAVTVEWPKVSSGNSPVLNEAHLANAKT
jgi:hypothetical protein